MSELMITYTLLTPSRERDLEQATASDIAYKQTNLAKIVQHCLCVLVCWLRGTIS